MEGPTPSFVEAATKRAGVTADEALAVFFGEYAFWLQRAVTFNNVNRLPRGERTEFEMSIRIYQTNPVSRLWYESMRPRLNLDFVRYIDNLSAEPDPARW